MSDRSIFPVSFNGFNVQGSEQSFESQQGVGQGENPESPQFGVGSTSDGNVHCESVPGNFSQEFGLSHTNLGDFGENVQDLQEPQINVGDFQFQRDPMDSEV